MRQSIPCPAQQLHSVALRYRLGKLSGESREKVNRFQPGNRYLAGVETPSSDSPSEQDEKRQRIEAILFLAREPLSARKLSQYANLADGTEARTLIRQLNALYDEGGRAFRVEEVAGGFQLLTRAKFASWLRRLGHVPAEIRLSAPSLETLAIIAYRQPVLRAAVEGIRGVNCGEILRQLMERDLVRICGRSDELGRPYLYGTTKRFLQTFGLVSLDQLPRAEVLRNTEVAGLDVTPSVRDEPSDAVQRDSSEIGDSRRVGSSRVDLQACKLEYSIVSPK